MSPKMISYILLLCVAGVVACQHSKYQLSNEWNSWKSQHGKSYETQKEELERHLVWLTNREYINAHNENEESVGFTLGMNQFGDMQDNEFAEKYLTHKPAERRGHHVKMEFGEQISEDNPTSVDWRQRGIVTSVKDQGQCGASYAFTVAAAIEGTTALATGNLKNLSVQNVIDCSACSSSHPVSYGNRGCQAGYVRNAFEYVLKRGGIDTEDAYPYVARQSSCNFSSSEVGANISSVISLKNGSESDLQTAVAYVGPVAVSVDASDKTFIYYRSGIYSSIRCSRYRRNHSMLVVGYGTYNSVDYWIVKNSWGKNWGEGGYIMMSRNLNNQCGIATDASYPIVYNKKILHAED